MILEAMCYADEAWLTQMEQLGSPVYEFDEAWPVTIEVKSLDFPIQVRIIGKGSILQLAILEKENGFQIVNQQVNLNYYINSLADFSNELALKIKNENQDAFQIQTIATAVRKIGEILNSNY